MDAGQYILKVFLTGPISKGDIDCLSVEEYEIFKIRMKQLNSAYHRSVNS